MQEGDDLTVFPGEALLRAPTIGSDSLRRRSRRSHSGELIDGRSTARAYMRVLLERVTYRQLAHTRK